MEQIYTLVIKGKPEGPFSLAELKEHQIKPDAFVRTPGMDDYKEAHEFPEIRSFLGFQKQFTLPQYFAGFDLRMLADAIDWFIIFGIIAFFELMLILFFNNKLLNMGIIISGFTLLPFLKFFYHVYMEFFQQATIGKKLINIKVTNLQGQAPTFKEVLLRNLSKLISTAFFFLGYLYLFLNKKQQTLHDVMAGTLVIKDRLI